MIVRRRIAIIAALTLAGVLAVVPAAPALAVPTAIHFVTTSPVAVAYGDVWYAQLRTTIAAEGTIPIPPTAGTVDVFASGLAEPIAAGLPIQPDGSVYVAAAQDAPLAPGSYELTAIFNPAAGTGIDSSQTSTPLVLEIGEFTLTAEAALEEEDDDSPVLELRLSGQYLEETGRVPEWSARPGSLRPRGRLRAGARVHHLDRIHSGRSSRARDRGDPAAHAHVPDPRRGDR
jgi:hypothetical protein